MSRCFPYPPPGYCRNGATYEALIESIKLRKETDKSKAEKKKEKRAKKEKKQKEKRKDEEKAKLKTTTNEYQQKAVEAHNKKTEINTEQVEKSVLTEEHGQPIGSQKPSYSSDSTQNSNKRKREDAIVPDGSSGYGKPIKIRLLKKHKPDSNNETLCHDSRGSDPPCLLDADARLNLVSSNRSTVVPSTSGRQNNAPPRILSSQTKSNPSSNRSKKPPQFVTKQSAPSSSARPIPPSSNSKHEIPSSSILPPGQHGISGSDLNKTTRFEKKKEDSTNEIAQKVGPTRREKKMQKKQLKYEKLIGSWVPPVLEAQIPDDDDQDWLSRRGAKVTRSSFSRDDVETCRELESLWQPCARWLVEADIYALPYTVPF